MGPASLRVAGTETVAALLLPFSAAVACTLSGFAAGGHDSLLAVPALTFLSFAPTEESFSRGFVAVSVTFFDALSGLASFLTAFDG